MASVTRQLFQVTLLPSRSYEIIQAEYRLLREHLQDRFGDAVPVELLMPLFHELSAAFQVGGSVEKAQAA